MEYMVRLTDIEKSFDQEDGGLLHVLDRVSIDVRPGEFVCILGPSGSGKSTTLDILAGLTEEDSGEVLIGDGRERFEIETGYVFQRPRLLNWRTVRQNLEFSLQARSIPKSEWPARIDEYLGLVGLRDFADAFPLTLSGGMQQRVAIARALAIRPDLLLMDEPFSSLDELTARHLRKELLRIWSSTSHTVMFVTHNALEAAYLADTVFIVGPRPATVVGRIEVEIPRPRDPEDVQVVALQRQIIGVLEDGGPGFSLAE